MILNNARDIKLGSTQVQKVYLGSTLIWPTTIVGPISTTVVYSTGSLCRFTVNGNRSDKSYIGDGNHGGSNHTFSVTPPTIYSLDNFWASDYNSGVSGDNNSVYLTSLNINFGNQTSNCTSMTNSFSGLRSCTSLTISNLDTSNVTTMEYAFGKAGSAAANQWTTLDLSGLNTSKVTDMDYMFGNSGSMTTLNISNWNMDRVSSYYRMFYNCSLSSITMNNVTNSVFNKVTNSSTSSLNTSCVIYRDGTTYRYSGGSWVAS